MGAEARLALPRPSNRCRWSCRGRSQSRARRKGAGAVAAELGCLPLALAQAAAVIADQHLGYSTYLDRRRAMPVSTLLAPTTPTPRERGQPRHRLPGRQAGPPRQTNRSPLIRRSVRDVRPVRWNLPPQVRVLGVSSTDTPSLVPSRRSVSQP